MDRIIRDNNAVINLDLKFAIILVISAVMAVFLIIPTLSHEEKDWRIKQYTTAVRISDNLVQDAGTPLTWEADWNRTAGNYSNVTKIGFTYTDANGIPVQKVLNLSKVEALMGEGYLDEGTQTRWWEFPNSTISQAERRNATRALGLERDNFYIQLHPVDTECTINPTSLETNLSNMHINKDIVSVIDRYVYIKDPSDPSPISYLTENCNGNKSIHYRLNLWVW